MVRLSGNVVLSSFQVNLLFTDRRTLIERIISSASSNTLSDGVAHGNEERQPRAVCCDGARYGIR